MIGSQLWTTTLDRIPVGPGASRLEQKDADVVLHVKGDGYRAKPRIAHLQCAQKSDIFEIYILSDLG